MMSQKHLHELLREDQEPFQLKHYIAHKKTQLQKAPPIPKTRKNTPSNRNCFFSLQYSPDPTKSPLGFMKSPKSVPVRLKIPTRTAALLFEAAIKIKTQSSRKPRSQIKNLGFNLFGSILKKLSRTRKCEIGNAGGESVISVSQRGFSENSCSSGVWSVESNEDKSMDIESSSSSGFDERESKELSFREKRFCSSPMTPFRFALQNCPSPSRRTPVFSSPATSPANSPAMSPTRFQDNEICKSEEEDEEKEQFSPVSVLDPPFQDDDDAGHEDGDDVDVYDIECGYKFVQRAKQQLLHKLRRFEKLAELDPIELEKRMLEEEEEEENEQLEDDFEETIDSIFSRNENIFDEFVNNILYQTVISRDMKKLVFDLVKEENQKGCSNEVVKMVRKKLDSWEEVKPNTIDMMVGFDFRGETEEWKGNGKDDMAKIGSEIEVGVFEMLVEELSEELFSLPKGY